MAMVISDARKPNEKRLRLNELKTEARTLISELADLGCKHTGWSRPVDKSLEDKIEAFEKRVEELQGELADCQESDATEAEEATSAEEAEVTSAESVEATSAEEAEATSAESVEATSAESLESRSAEEN
ncbi:hypothetical protein V1264_008459 [Littorina saxatilis]